MRPDFHVNEWLMYCRLPSHDYKNSMIQGKACAESQESKPQWPFPKTLYMNTKIYRAIKKSEFDDMHNALGLPI
jgi:hypothetical protein